MLLNDFYTVAQQEHEPGTVKATLHLNAAHRIFEGHFPGHPVVPGVCMLQMVREVMELNTGGKLMVAAADMMKFLSIINPVENHVVDLRVTYTETQEELSINATLFSGNVTYFKLTSTLRRTG
jgi:3-hydroxyacyl-[acyl-carrier-protein] dehydratase